MSASSQEIKDLYDAGHSALRKIEYGHRDNPQVVADYLFLASAHHNKGFFNADYSLRYGQLVVPRTQSGLPFWVPSITRSVPVRSEDILNEAREEDAWKKILEHRNLQKVLRLSEHTIPVELVLVPKSLLWNQFAEAVAYDFYKNVKFDPELSEKEAEKRHMHEALKRMHEPILALPAN